MAGLEGGVAFSGVGRGSRWRVRMANCGYGAEFRLALGKRWRRVWDDTGTMERKSPTISEAWVRSTASSHVLLLEIEL